MKSQRHAKILEIIDQYEIETQEELLHYLKKAGFPVTQATISRDIRELRLRKADKKGHSCYGVQGEAIGNMDQRYQRVFREGFASMDMAQNILVIKTVSGMAMAVAAALDHMDCHEIVGSIAGDDTIMCAVRTVEDTAKLMGRLRRIVDQEMI